MFPEDIEGLFPNVPVGTPVHILNEPVKVGWASGELYVEVHPPLEEDRAGRVRLNLTRLIEDAAAGAGDTVDWRRAGDAWSEARGIPEPIGGGPSRVARAEASPQAPGVAAP
jgi:L,D-transpeptidase ErfK/SrfK